MSRQTTFLVLLIAGLMTFALFVVSYQVQDLEDQLDQLNQGILEDRDAVHVLQAEWSHLNDPARLRLLAEKYLGLTTLTSEHLADPQTIPWRGLNVDADDPANPHLLETGAEAAQ